MVAADLRARPDAQLEAVVLHVVGEDLELVLSVNSAVDLVLGLIGAVDRLSPGAFP
jgi:hypothetical protein